MPKKFNFVSTALMASILFFSFQSVKAQQENTLTAAEKANGWQLLFNGKDLTGWHSYLGQTETTNSRGRMISKKSFCTTNRCLTAMLISNLEK